MVAALNFENNGSLQVFLDECGIMQVEYPLHTRISFEKIQEEYYKRLQITQDKTPLLVQLHGMVFFEVAAREFLCGEKNSAITSAAAVLLDPRAGYQGQSNIFMEMFKLFDKPPFPVEVFEDKEAAMAWLKQYL
jgi:hypothetical protein